MGSFGTLLLLLHRVLNVRTFDRQNEPIVVCESDLIVLVRNGVAEDSAVVVPVHGGHPETKTELKKPGKIQGEDETLNFLLSVRPSLKRGFRLHQKRGRCTHAFGYEKEESFFIRSPLPAKSLMLNRSMCNRSFTASSVAIVISEAKYTHFCRLRSIFLLDSIRF